MFGHAVTKVGKSPFLPAYVFTKIGKRPLMSIGVVPKVET